MESQQIRVIVFKEGDMWAAQCLEFDIGAQAPDLDELHARLETVLCLELQASLEQHGEPFGGIEAAPRHFHELWEKRSRAFALGAPISVKGDGKGVTAELALAA